MLLWCSKRKSLRDTGDAIMEKTSKDDEAAAAVSCAVDDGNEEEEARSGENPLADVEEEGSQRRSIHSRDKTVCAIGVQNVRAAAAGPSDEEGTVAAAAAADDDEEEEDVMPVLSSLYPPPPPPLPPLLHMSAWRLL